MSSATYSISSDIPDAGRFDDATLASSSSSDHGYVPTDEERGNPLLQSIDKFVDARSDGSHQGSSYDSSHASTNGNVTSASATPGGFSTSSGLSQDLQANGAVAESPLLAGVRGQALNTMSQPQRRVNVGAGASAGGSGSVMFQRGPNIKRKRRAPAPLSSGIVPLAAHERPLFDRSVSGGASTTSAILDSNNAAVRASHARRQLMPAIPVRRTSANQPKLATKIRKEVSSSSIKSSSSSATEHGRVDLASQDGTKDLSPSKSQSESLGNQVSGSPALFGHLTGHAIAEAKPVKVIDPRLSIVSHAPSESDYGDDVSVADEREFANNRESSYGGAVATPRHSKFVRSSTDPRASTTSFRWSQGEWSEYAAQLSNHISVGEPSTPAAIPEEAPSTPEQVSRISQDSRHHVQDGQRFSIVNRTPRKDRVLRTLSDTEIHPTSGSPASGLGIDLEEKNGLNSPNSNDSLQPSTPLLAQLGHKLALSADQTSSPAGHSPNERSLKRNSTTENSPTAVSRADSLTWRKQRPPTLHLGSSTSPHNLSRNSLIVSLSSPSFGGRTPPPTNPPAEPLPPLPSDAITSARKASVSSDLGSYLPYNRDSSGSSIAASGLHHNEGSKHASVSSINSAKRRGSKASIAASTPLRLQADLPALPDTSSDSYSTARAEKGQLRSLDDPVEKLEESNSKDVSEPVVVHRDMHDSSTRESLTDETTEVTNPDDTALTDDAEEAIITSVTGTRNSVISTPTIVRPESAQLYALPSRKLSQDTDLETSADFARRAKLRADAPSSVGYDSKDSALTPTLGQRASLSPASPLLSPLQNFSNLPGPNLTHHFANGGSAGIKAAPTSQVRDAVSVTDHDMKWPPSANDSNSSYAHANELDLSGATGNESIISMGKQSGDSSLGFNRSDMMKPGGFAEIAAAFKQLRAEKQVLENIVRATTPLDGVSNHGNLAEYLVSMPAKLDVSTREIHKLLELLDRQKSVMDYMVDTHRLELDAQLEEVEELQLDLEAADEEAETHRLNAIALTEKLDRAEQDVIAARAEAMRHRTGLAEERQQHEATRQELQTALLQVAHLGGETLPVPKTEHATSYDAPRDAKAAGAASQASPSVKEADGRIQSLERELAHLRVINTELETRAQQKPALETHDDSLLSATDTSHTHRGVDDDAEREALHSKLLQQEKDIAELRAQIALGPTSISNASGEDESPDGSPATKMLASSPVDRADQVRALMAQMTEQRAREAQIRTAYRQVRDELRKLQTSQQQERKRGPATMTLLQAQSPQHLSTATMQPVSAPGGTFAGMKHTMSEDVGADNGTATVRATPRQLKRLSLPMGTQSMLSSSVDDDMQTVDSSIQKSMLLGGSLAPQMRSRAAPQNNRSSWRYSSIDFTSASPIFSRRRLSSSEGSGTARDAALKVLSGGRGNDTPSPTASPKLPSSTGLASQQRPQSRMSSSGSQIGVGGGRSITSPLGPIAGAASRLAGKTTSPSEQTKRVTPPTLVSPKYSTDDDDHIEHILSPTRATMHIPAAESG